MTAFNWAYIGCGGIAESTARQIVQGNHRIVSVYGRTPEKVRAFAEKYDAKPFADFDSAVHFDGVDGVYIATPHTAHAAYAIRAMELHKPVLCEKPVGVTVQDVNTLTDTAKRTNTYFCEAMWTWFSDVALTVKQWVQSGEIGTVRDVVINYAFPGILLPKTSRVRTPETAGGALLDIEIYPITYCYNLFGVPNRVRCRGKIQNGIDVRETVVLEYPNFKCTLHMSLCSLKENCRIIGTKGTISLPVFFHMASKAILNNADGRRVFRGKTDYITEFDRVAEEIRQGKTESAYIPFAATRACMEIMDECRRQMGLQYPFER